MTNELLLRPASARTRRSHPPSTTERKDCTMPDTNAPMSVAEAQWILSAANYSPALSYEALVSASGAFGIRKVVQAVRTVADAMNSQIAPIEQFFIDGTQPADASLAKLLANQR